MERSGIVASVTAGIMALATAGQQLRVMFLDSDLSKAMEVAQMANKAKDQLLSSKEELASKLKDVEAGVGQATKGAAELQATVNDLQVKLGAAVTELATERAKNTTLQETVTNMTNICRRR